MSHKFNHSVLASKAICISFLREFGVAKDWTRVTIGEMRRMLASYADERLFDALDPNRKLTRVADILAGRRQPLVSHPIDRLLQGVS